MAKVIVLTSNIEYYKPFVSEYVRADKKYHILTEHISCVEEVTDTHSVVHTGPNSFHVNEKASDILTQIWN
jgi:ribosomal protein S17